MSPSPAMLPRRASHRPAPPPAGPARPPVPDLTEVHGPLYPTERRHEFPRDPPPRYLGKIPRNGPI